MLYFKSSKNSYLYINFVIIFTFISLSRLVACFYYIDFSGDQIRDQLILIKCLPLLLVIIWYFYLFGSFNQTVQYLANKYGPNPKANTNDYIQTINSANNNDIICTNNNNHQAFEFLLKYRNPTNKSLLLKDC